MTPGELHPTEPQRMDVSHVQVQVDQVCSVYSQLQEVTQEANQRDLLQVSSLGPMVCGDHLVRWAILTILKGLKASFSGIKHMHIVVQASHPPCLQLFHSPE